MRSMATATLVCMLGLTACGSDDGGGGSGGAAAASGASGTSGTGGVAGQSGMAGMAGTGGGAGAAGTAGAAGAAPFELTSSAFAEGEEIPTVHECGPSQGPGTNASPPFSWTAGPSGTQSYAIVMRDLDFNNLVHWVIYDIPANVSSLPGNVPHVYTPPDPAGSKQALLQGAVYGYFGPCSPNSVNTYQWTLHALGTATLPGVDQNTSENSIAAAIEAASIASASLSGES